MLLKEKELNAGEEDITVPMAHLQFRQVRIHRQEVISATIAARYIREE